MTSLRRSFLAMKRDVAKTASSIALRIDAVVLHAPARCDLYLAGFDERRQRARQPHPSAGDIGLGDENAVQQRVNVILQQRFRQQPQIDRRVLGDGEFLLQRVGKALVAAFEDVWAVEPVSFEQRVSDLVTVADQCLLNMRETLLESRIGEEFVAEAYERAHDIYHSNKLISYPAAVRGA